MALAHDELAAMRKRCERATEGPWVDLRKIYNDAMARRKKATKRWWHGSKKESCVVTLIACGTSHQGRQVTPDSIPKQIDRFDLKTVVSVVYGRVMKRDGCVYQDGGLIKEEDTDFICHSRTDVPKLLDDREEGLKHEMALAQEVSRLRKGIRAIATDQSFGLSGCRKEAARLIEAPAPCTEARA